MAKGLKMEKDAERRLLSRVNRFYGVGQQMPSKCPSGARGPAPRVDRDRLAEVSRRQLESHAARWPPPPDILVDALHDRVHPASGRLLATKAITPKVGK